MIGQVCAKAPSSRPQSARDIPSPRRGEGGERRSREPGEGRGACDVGSEDLSYPAPLRSGCFVEILPKAVLPRGRGSCRAERRRFAGATRLGRSLALPKGGFAAEDDDKTPRGEREKPQPSTANCFIAIGCLLALAGIARADTGDRVLPSNLATSWNADPVILLTLVLVVHLYSRGVRRLWRSGSGHGVSTRQVIAFSIGIAILAAALLSPLDRLSDHLASAHMVQHLLLMVVAAPLLVLGNTSLVLLSGVPQPFRTPLGRLWQRVEIGGWLWNPVLLVIASALVLWLWHIPVLYQAALNDAAVHDLQHLTFLGSAFLFWRAVLDPVSRRRLHPLVGAGYLFVAMLASMALGVFMALAPRPWYPVLEGRTEIWGVSAVEDQQLAGLIMWMPAGLVYAAVAAGLLVHGLEKEER